MDYIDYPGDTRILLYNKLHKLALSQQCYYDLMMRLSDIINRAMSDYRDPVSGDFMNMKFTDFLTCIFRSYDNVKNSDDDRMLFDEFIRIAEFSVEALGAVIRHPSTHIEKITLKVPVSRFKQGGSKTDKWLAQRSGRTIAEKVSPENKIASSKVLFSADTKENQEAMYLYKILYDLAASRTEDISLSSVDRNDKAIYTLVKLLRYNTKIRQSELSEVPAKKQALQNNKLMCDKNYKKIWDAVKQISHVEEKLEQDWKMLRQRYSALLYWVILAELFVETKVNISDYLCKLEDENGKLSLNTWNRSMNGHLSDTTFVVNLNSLKDCFNVRIYERMISVDNQNYSMQINLDDYFDYLYANIMQGKVELEGFECTETLKSQK